MSNRSKTVGLAAIVLVLLASVVGFAQSGDLKAYEEYHLRRDGANGGVAVTFLGTSTLLFDDDETQLLVDGFISRPSRWQTLFGKVQTEKARVDEALERVKADRIAAVFVVHSHYDHLLDAPYIAASRHGPTARLCDPTGLPCLYGSESTRTVGRARGVAEDQLRLFHVGDDLRFNGFTVRILNSRHGPPALRVLDDIGRTITKAPAERARQSEYLEGGSFDLLITHGEHRMLVKASTNYDQGALEGLPVDVLFLGTARLAKQTKAFQNAYYDQTVGKTHPTLVVPVHWDDFWKPLDKPLRAPPFFIDNLSRGFDFMIGRLCKDKIQFGWMEGYERVVLFNGKQPNPAEAGRPCPKE